MFEQRFIDSPWLVDTVKKLTELDAGERLDFKQLKDTLPDRMVVDQWNRQLRHRSKIQYECDSEVGHHNMIDREEMENFECHDEIDVCNLNPNNNFQEHLETQNDFCELNSDQVYNNQFNGSPQRQDHQVEHQMEYHGDHMNMNVQQMENQYQHSPHQHQHSPQQQHQQQKYGYEDFTENQDLQYNHVHQQQQHYQEPHQHYQEPQQHYQEPQQHYQEPQQQ